MGSIVVLLVVWLFVFALGMFTGAWMLLENQRTEQRRKENAAANRQWEQMLDKRRRETTAEDDWNGWFQ